MARLTMINAGEQFHYPGATAPINHALRKAPAGHAKRALVFCPADDYVDDVAAMTPGRIERPRTMNPTRKPAYDVSYFSMSATESMGNGAGLQRFASADDILTWIMRKTEKGFVIAIRNVRPC